MEQGTETRTLYEDWNARRHELAAEGPGADDSRAIQIKVLDYLLERYRDSPAAARPVRCPQPKRLYVNDRALIVLRHLGSDWCRRIVDRHDALAHVQSVISKRAFRGPERASAEPLSSSAPLDRADETLRLQLSDKRLSTRWLAAIKLATVGRLEDISLLSDLLTLATNDRERSALIYAIRRLAEFEHEAPEPAPPEDPPEAQPAVTTESTTAQPEAIIENVFDPGPDLPDWTCARCGTAVSWYREKCHGCGASYTTAGNSPPA